MQPAIPKMLLSTLHAKSTLQATVKSNDLDNSVNSIAGFVEEITDLGLEGFADVSVVASLSPAKAISLRV